jgi:hypothetical protein
VAFSSVLAVVIPTTVWSAGDGSRARVVSASGGKPSLGTVGDTGATADGTTTVPSPDESAVRDDVVPTTPRPLTERRPIPATTAPETTAPPSQESLGLEGPDTHQPPRCTAADLEVAVTTDKPSYGPGEVVKVSGTLRNRSSQTCIYGSSLRFEVRDAAGTRVFGFSTHADYIAGHEPTLAPGHSTATTPAEWPQRRCTGFEACTSAPPGTYQVVVDVSYAVVTIPVTIGPGENAVP